jgi:hypothetical protein
MSTLRVYARGTDMVFHHLSPRHEYVGRTFDASLASDKALGGWRPRTTPSEIPAHPDFIKALRDGSLWAADEATAKAAGVAFDPTFAGEFTSTASAAHDDEET